MKDDVQGEIFNSLFAAADALGFRYACFGSMSETVNERRKDGYPWLAVTIQISGSTSILTGVL